MDLVGNHELWRRSRGRQSCPAENCRDFGAVAGGGQMEPGTDVPIVKLPSKRSKDRLEAIFADHSL